MAKQQLIIGIDITNEYCQACYYNWHHNRPESVMAGANVMRFLIPAVICYNEEEGNWIIGEEAMLYSEKSGCFLFRDFLNGMEDGAVLEIDGEKKGYDTITAIYLGKLLEHIRISSGIMNIESVNVTMRRVGADMKAAIRKVFAQLNVEPSKIRLLSYAESFTYYVLGEDETLWKDGALLYDFDEDGFFSKQITFTGDLKNPLIYVNEKNHSMEFSVKDLASELLRGDLDMKLLDLFEDVKFAGSSASVFFTGTGFSELWFTKTLNKISENYRVFRGNNLYVKGACLAGFLRIFKGGKDYPIICRGRTKAAIAVKAVNEGMINEIELSRAATDWFDAGSTRDFILEGDKNVRFVVTSLISRERTNVDFDLSDFPERTDKATRVEVSVRYINESECEIKIKDKGFGAFFESGGQEVAKRLNLEGYI